MENKYEYIDNVALSADSDIEKKQKSPLKAILILLVGAGGLYWGTVHVPSNSSDVLSSLLIIVGLILIVWGIVAFFMKGDRYIVKSSGKVLKKHKVYIAPNYSSKLYQVIEDGKLEELKDIPRTNQSNLSVEVLCEDDGEYALLQVMEFVPYNDIPMTPVKEYRGVQAHNVADFLKGK